MKVVIGPGFHSSLKLHERDANATRWSTIASGELRGIVVDVGEVIVGRDRPDLVGLEQRVSGGSSRVRSSPSLYF
jgi:hypothetical protein